MYEQYVDKNIEFFPDGKLFRILFDNTLVKFRILTRDPLDLESIIKSFSDDNPGAFFSRQFGFHTDSKVYTVNKFGYFSLGLIFEVLKWIKTNYGSLSCVAVSENVKKLICNHLTPLKEFALRNNRDSFEVSNISNKYELRPYQTEIIKSIIFDGYGRGLFESPTGSGKSFTISNFIYTLQKQYDSSLRYLIFVPNKQLVEQFYKDLLDYGFQKEELTKLTGGEQKKYNPNCKIIIGNRQFIFKNMKLLPKIDVLICDESHSISPNSNTFDFVENLNCSIKVGCSGTLPRNKYAKLSLMGIFNRIIYTEEVVNLQNKGYLSKLQINLISIVDSFVDNHVELPFSLKTRQKYVEGGDIAFNEAYNSEIEYIGKNYEKLYAPIIEKLKFFKGNVLILFDRIEFGKNMYEYAKEIHPRESDIFYVDGSVKVDIREEIRKKMEETSNNILFAETAVMSTGINIRNLENIVFMFSGKSLSRTIQSIGRTLRLHKDKDMAKCWDICFNMKYSRKHLKERMKLYKEFYNKSKPDNIEKILV